MTNEEVINTLNEMWERLFTEMRGWIFEDLKEEGKLDEFKKAFDMTIKILEQEPCDDCISREAVLALAKEECETAIIPYKRFIKGVNALPSVQHKTKTGKWTEFRHEEWANNIYIKCSECEKIYHFDEKEFNFCPNCGADMRTKVESEE